MRAWARRWWPPLPSVCGGDWWTFTEEYHRARAVRARTISIVAAAVSVASFAWWAWRAFA